MENCKHRYYPNSRQKSDTCIICGFRPNWLIPKEEFKKKVLDWLTENKIFPKKLRIYYYRKQWEMRIYQEPMEIPNQRKSFRERKEERDEQRHGSYGIHSSKISLYTHINEDDLKSPEEKEFILQTLKDNLK